MSNISSKETTAIEYTLCNIDIDVDWDKVHKLPLYYMVDNTSDFLRLAEYAKLKPIGVVRDHKAWYVLFKYCVEIKYIDKYFEDYQFSKKKWDELRNALSSQNRTYYELLQKSAEARARLIREARQRTHR